VERQVDSDAVHQVGRDVVADLGQMLEDVVQEHRVHFGQARGQAALDADLTDPVVRRELRDALRAELEAARELGMVQQEFALEPQELAGLQPARVQSASGRRALQELRPQAAELVGQAAMRARLAAQQLAQEWMAFALQEVQLVLRREERELLQRDPELRRKPELLVARRPEAQQDEAGEQRVRQLPWLASRRRRWIRRPLQRQIGLGWCCELFPRHPPESNWSGFSFRPLRSPAKGQ
jgi:hypothetical protein